MSESSDGGGVEIERSREVQGKENGVASGFKTSEVRSEESMERRYVAEPEPYPPAHDRRLAAVRDFDGADRSPLLHTDSGFDEHMVDEIELGPALQPASYADREPEPEPLVKTKDDDDPPADLNWQSLAPETPGSFHTTMTSLEDPFVTKGPTAIPHGPSLPEDPDSTMTNLLAKPDLVPRGPLPKDHSHDTTKTTELHKVNDTQHTSFHGVTPMGGTQGLT